MNLLTRLENKTGWHGVAHLPIYIVAAQAISYLWIMLNPDQVSLLLLEPAAVRYQHEYWRLLTFLFITPLPPPNPLFAFFYLYLIYVYGSALELEWGSFPFTLFYFVGAIGTIVGGLWFGSTDGAFFLNTTIFLAFAALHPNFELLLFFFIPFKVKWLAWLTWAYFAYLIVVAPAWSKIGILISLANYVLFFGAAHAANVRASIASYQHRRRFRKWDVR